MGKGAVFAGQKAFFTCVLELKQFIRCTLSQGASFVGKNCARNEWICPGKIFDWRRNWPKWGGGGWRVLEKPVGLQDGKDWKEKNRK